MNNELVTTTTATAHPYAKAFAWAGICLTALTGSFTVAYRNFSPEEFGRFVAITAISAGIVGFQASRAKMRWSFWKIGSIYLIVAIAVALVANYGAGRAP